MTFRSALAGALCVLLSGPVYAQSPDGGAQAQAPDPAAVLDHMLAAAEAALREGELQIAESRYRALVFEAWMLMGELRAIDGTLDAARDAFRDATTAVVDAIPAFHSLAIVHMQKGEPREAVAILTKLAARNQQDTSTRRTLAQALIASGEPEEAVQTLEEAHAAAPEDDRLAFVLAGGYLHVKKNEAADKLLDRIAANRPIAETHVLIGRAYRDAGRFDRARDAFRKALAIDSRVRRAHYYLGTLAVMAEGVLRLEEAIREFREELKVAPDDPLTNLRLGMAYVEARQPAEALRPLEIATRGTLPPSDALLYLGRCQLALNQPAAAVTSLRRALERSEAESPDHIRRRNIHYQLALALRQTGDGDEAAEHFARSEQAAAQRADTEREELARYLADAPQPAGTGATMTLPFEWPLAALAAPRRAEVERRVNDALARAYLNLGIMHAQAQRFARAAEVLERAAAVHPDFPHVQYSLGVSYFNAGQHAKAVAPLERALAATPADAAMRRMLAVALLNADDPERAASLLAADPQRESDPSLQYAYGLALVRSGRSAEAEAMFTRLFRAHGATPELRVVLAQAHAQQGDFDSAMAELKLAIEQNPKVADAHATLGHIYLRQGKLGEARSTLQEGLKAHPGDHSAAHALATVLDLEGTQEEALAILRPLLVARPDFADARYLLGKILLARGVVDEAAEQLEAAARLAPEDANTHYQLAQAYQKQGRAQLAEERFELYRQLKDKRRGR